MESLKEKEKMPNNSKNTQGQFFFDKENMLLYWLCTGLFIVTYFLIWLFNSGRPLAEHNVFLWAIALPLLITIGRGFLSGLFSVVLIAGCSIAFNHFVLKNTLVSVELLSIMVVMCAFAAVFRHQWLTKQKRLERIVSYQSMRMREFSQDYQLLKQSHTLLEQQKAGPEKTEMQNSLYGTMRNIRQSLLTGARGDGPHLQQCGHMIMTLLKTHGHVQVGAFLGVICGEIDTQGPVIRTGNMPALRRKDPLIASAVTHKKSVCISAEHLKRGGLQMESNLLACVPFVDSDENVHGVLAIRQMPFGRLKQKHLNHLQVLCSYIADSLYTANVLPAEYGGGNTQLYEFHSHLQRCLKDVQNYQIKTGLMVITIKNTLVAPSLVDSLMGNKEVFEVLLSVKDPYQEHVTVFILMPLTSEKQLKKKVDAFPDFIMRQQQISTVSAQTTVSYFSVMHAKQFSGLNGFLQQHHYPLSHALVVVSSKDSERQINKKKTVVS